VKLRLAFAATGGDGWIAGRVHTSVFIHALKEVYGESVCVSLISERRDSELERFAKEHFCEGILSRKLLLSQKIDAVFGSVVLKSYEGVPVLSWLPDFQHVHLPEMFDAKARLDRNRVFLNSAKFSSRVMLMSQMAKRDFESALPEYAHKGRVLKTASHVPTSVYTQNPRQVISRYGLPEKFVYMPNQFWKHKNHRMVLKVIKNLKETSCRVNLVCSGSTSDYRHADHFAALKHDVKSWGLEAQVWFLGMIPRSDVFQLIRQSVFVLNPSLFEGFGLSVDEAKSIGKRLLISDIPSLREQQTDEIEFFNPNEPSELEFKLRRAYRNGFSGPDPELEKHARRVYLKRLRTSAESFMSVVEEVLEKPCVAPA
jgi:glycosyltransferase involved in cell wall biosynthesis